MALENARSDPAKARVARPQVCLKPRRQETGAEPRRPGWPKERRAGCIELVQIGSHVQIGTKGSRGVQNRGGLLAGII